MSFSFESFMHPNNTLAGKTSNLLLERRIAKYSHCVDSSLTLKFLTFLSKNYHLCQRKSCLYHWNLVVQGNWDTELFELCHLCVHKEWLFLQQWGSFLGFQDSWNQDSAGPNHWPGILPSGSWKTLWRVAKCTTIYIFSALTNVPAF
jgi:hypothetical protein